MLCFKTNCLKSNCFIIFTKCLLYKVVYLLINIKLVKINNLKITETVNFPGQKIYYLYYIIWLTITKTKQKIHTT